MARARSQETAERILAQALDLFNRFGEPNVSPAQLAGMLGMSTGNLYYHFPSKADLVASLFKAHQLRLKKILPASVEIADTEDAWFFINTLFELISEYRFIYRDLTDLLSKSIQLERQIQSTLGQTTTALSHLIRGLQRHGALAMNKKYDPQVLAVNMTLVMTYWLSYDYIQSPRQALDPLYAGSALAQGAYQTLHVLSPFMQGAAAQHWLLLSEAYL